MRLQRRLFSAFLFLLPFAVLLVLWAVLVPYFNVNPRLFPHLSAVWEAGVEAIQDGSLPAHIGASLLRVRSARCSRSSSRCRSASRWG